MKPKFKFFVAFFLLLVAYSWASKWTIDSFDTSSDPGEADNFIAEEFSGGLKPVQPSQVTQQSGRLYVRQKFEDPFGDDEATYQIFQGRATEASKSLGKISLEGIPYTTLLKMKLFYSKSATGDDDLETVYYDGKDIFVEGEDPVYINLNGRMEELKPLASREYKISITSQPSGATVMVGGSSKGETPVTFSVPSSKTIAVVVSKEGYYTTIKPITPADKQTTQEGILLTEKKELANPAEAFRSKLQTAVSSKDANAVKSLKTSIQQALNTYNSDSKKSIDAVMSKFPANPPKASNESSTDYSARQSLWTNTQSKERDALSKEAQGYFTELKDLLTEVDAAVGDMDFALKYEYIPSSAISITNLGIKDFTLEAGVSNSRVAFSYDKAKLAYGTVPRNELAQDQESVHGVLKIWNTPNESGKYASIYDIAFFYDETPLKILTKGTFTLDNANAASRNVERDLNGRIARYSGKAAWDKRDEEATLAALRTGEIPDAPVATAKAKAPEPVAYYDEDEDDDEFDDEMEDQDRYDYARYGAVGSATDIFGNTDEYLFWAGMFFAAAAIGTGVVGFLENSKYLEANDALSGTNNRIEYIKDEIRKACRDANGGDDDPECTQRFIDYSNSPDALNNNSNSDVAALYHANQIKKQNQKTRDSYNLSRIIWFSSAGVAAAISITLFAW